MPEEFLLISDETLRLIADIIGPDSASRRALDNLARRRAAGEDAACYKVPGCPMFFIGPRVPARTEN